MSKVIQSLIPSPEKHAIHQEGNALPQTPSMQQNAHNTN